MRFLVVALVLVAALVPLSATSAEQPILVRVEVGDRSEADEVGRILDLDEKTRGNVLFGWGTVKQIDCEKAPPSSFPTCFPTGVIRR